MAKLTVAQATAVRDVIRYLAAPNEVYTAEMAANALATLASDAFARMMAGPRQNDARDAIAAVEQLRAELATYRRDDRHIVDLRADGWTIQHPMACRPNLFDCPVNNAAGRDLDGPPSELGRFYCGVVEGLFVIDGPIEEVES